MKPVDFKNMQFSELTAKESKWKNALHNLDEQARDLRHNLQLVGEEIARRQKAPINPRVSEHAVLRYLERAKGVDTEAIRAEILTPMVVSAMKAGAATVSVDGVKFVIDGDCLVTVLGSDMRAKPKGKAA